MIGDEVPVGAVTTPVDPMVPTDWGALWGALDALWAGEVVTPATVTVE